MQSVQVPAFSLRTAKIVPEGVKAIDLMKEQRVGFCCHLMMIMSSHDDHAISCHISLCCGGIVRAGGGEVGHSWGEYQGLRMRG